MKKLFFVPFLILIQFFCFSDTSSKKNRPEKKDEPQIVYNETFEQAKELFGLNKPEEAVALFEKIIDEKNIDPAVYIYLGVAYYQTGDYPKSYSVCTKGLALPGTDHKILAFNAGNSAYALGNYARADACYAISLKEDENFASACLNRANAQLKQDHLQDARTNYEKFLSLDAENEQAEKIRYLITLLDAEIERRANEKPEMIDPDEFVENSKMEVPAEPEKVIYENPGVFEEDVPVTDELVTEDARAPELPPEELELEADAAQGEYVKSETLPPEKDEVSPEKKQEEIVSGEKLLPRMNQTETELPGEPEVKETVSEGTIPDFIEPSDEKPLEAVDEEDKKAPL